ncbi:hypothetical protein HanPI659440_Chr03g0099281 [Helianthus annuus]|nr:hypothetical protein HanPI659440_Chr03g0099281 [Helianthus annuus]
MRVSVIELRCTAVFIEVGRRAKSVVRVAVSERMVIRTDGHPVGCPFRRMSIQTAEFARVSFPTLIRLLSIALR